MIRVALVLGLFLGCLPAATAQPNEPADLFPPSTLAYAECRDPARLADTVAVMVKGTALDDGLKLLHDRRDANRDSRLFAGQPGLSALVSATSPEFLAEVRKLRGVAVGLTGFTKTFEPKIAAVVLTGESVAAGLLAKSFLANDANLRRVAVVEGVPVFQSRALPAVGFDPTSGKAIVPEPAKATEGPCEPTYAYTPGLFVVASNVEAVTDILVRHRGKGGESLRDRRPYPRDSRIAGVEFFVRLADLVAIADTARKARNEVVDPAMIAYLKLVLGVQASPVIAGHFQLRTDGLAGEVRFARSPNAVSPLFDLMTGTLSASALSICPRNMAGTWTVGLPAKENRASAVLRLADAIAKADGEVGKLPSDWLAEVEQKQELPIRRDYLSTVQAVSVLMPNKQELPAKVEPLPMVALHLESEAAANAWLAALPKLAGTATPSAETIHGVRVLTFEYGSRPIHIARVGTAIVCGLDRKLVAAICAGVGGPNLLTDLTTKKMTLPDAATMAFATFSPVGLALVDFGGRGEARDLPVDGLSPLPLAQQPLFTEKELATAFATFPPVVGRVLKRADGPHVELRFDFGPAGAKAIVEGLIPLVEKLGTTAGGANGRLFLDR